MKKSLSLFLLIFLSFSACDDGFTEVVNEDYFVFGRFSGFCVGDCFSVFKADSESLTEDETSEKYTGADYEYIPGRTLNQGELLLAKELFAEIPSTLLANDKEVYGCPDCADQGGFYINFKINGIERTFLLDTRQTDDQSETLLTYKEKLATLIQELNS